MEADPCLLDCGWGLADPGPVGPNGAGGPDPAGPPTMLPPPPLGELSCDVTADEPPPLGGIGG